MLLLFGSLIIILIQNARALEGEGIIGGIKVEPNELKYQISLQAFDQHLCGGTIIGEQHVVTAAHCIIDEDSDEFITNQLTVFAGIVDIHDGSGQHVRVVKAYVPKKFNATEKTFNGDIAVLKLEHKLGLRTNSNLSKVHLPFSTESQLTAENSFVNVEALVSGFGWDEIEFKVVDFFGIKIPVPDGRASGKLHKAKALVLDNAGCQKSYDDNDDDRVILESQICARVVQHEGDVQQGVCLGDSGGPLVYEEKLIGVVSNSPIGCNDANQPAIYTRVSAYIDFINNAKKSVLTDDMRSVDL